MFSPAKRAGFAMKASPLCMFPMLYVLAQVTAAETCSPLKNQGAFFTAELEVGTSILGAKQVFNAVADTGSNAVVIPSCVCKECIDEGRCFRGTNKSSTFFIEDKGGLLHGVAIMFGSGPIQAVIATDVVKVGAVSANMSESLLLMTRHNLQVPKGFEGILGLGIPEVVKHHDAPHLSKGISTMETGDEQEKPEVPAIPGFLEKAGVHTFSLCFLDQGKDGSLQLGRSLSSGLTSIGEMHWGLDLFGVSVGKDHVAVKMDDKPLCSEVPKGKKTGCGSIPDSGSTAIMAPFSQLSAVLDVVCDQWPRCVEAAKKIPDQDETPSGGGTMPFLQTQSAELRTVRRHSGEAKGPIDDLLRKLGIGHSSGNPMSEGSDEPDVSAQIGVDPGQEQGPAMSKKGQAFQLLLEGCQEWLTDDAKAGMAEIPSLNFHLRGGNKQEQLVELPAWSWISQMEAEEVNHTIKNIHGIQVDVQEATGKKRTVCAPMLAGMDFNTAHNGPVWILGGPLYYQYTVGFNTQEKSVHFEAGGPESCSVCGGGSVGSVLQGAAEVSSGHQAASFQATNQREPVRLSGPWRRSTVDTTQPYL